MNNEQIRDELQSYLEKLNQQQHILLSSHEKFRIALAGSLKLIGDTSTTLKHLHGTSDDVKGYLIQLSINLCNETKNAFENLRREIEPIQELVQQLNRKD
ncbi:hypothetical protein EU527_10355 [Candidatus Thorarchaeota archaeon]|nr:MAG: hypothetical protein EU527_10355 [Candidatus Thorarchaeota archaeon]